MRIFKFGMASLIAAVAGLALVAGSAVAEVKVAIQTDGTYGTLSDETTGPAGAGTIVNDEGLAGSYEANLNLRGESGDVRWAGRFRVRDDGGKTLTTHRSILAWQFAEQVELQFHGRSFGGDSMNVGGISGVIGRFPFGDASNYISWEDHTFLNANLDVGAVVFGFGVADECIIGCGSVDTITPSLNDQTIILHAHGAAGGFKWGVQFATAEGDVPGALPADPATATDGSGFELGLKWSGPVSVGAQFVSLTEDLQTTAPAAAADSETVSISVGFSVEGFKVHFKSSETELGGLTTRESTNIDASYGFPIAPGVVVGPEFRSETVETPAPGGISETEKTLIGVAYSASF